jgi:hypothetical protein
MIDDKPLSWFTKLVFWFVALNALAGGLSLLLFPDRTDAFFFWPIRPPLSAALFGALYLGGAAAVAWVTWRGYWEPARFLVPVLVTAGVLLTAVTLLHLDIFRPGLGLVYWLTVYIVAPLLAVIFYIQYERNGANWAVTGQAITPATRNLAIATGVVVLLFGAVALIRPQWIIPIWPWPIAPLMLRVFAAWFAAFGAGLLWVLRERDWHRFRPIANLMIAAAGLDLVMSFVHRTDFQASDLAVGLYIFHLAAFGLVGVLLHLLQRGR